MHATKRTPFPKMKKLCRIYNNLQTLSRMEYSTRNKQRNSEKNQTQRYSEQKPETMSRKKFDSKMGNNTILHRKQQGQKDKACRQEH